jgi:enoyl-CoA hydratase/carnithine racemase
MGSERPGTGIPEALVESDGPVVRFTIDRPAKLNAINEPVERALCDAVDRLERDPARRVLVIRARGSYFSAGYDVSYRVDDAHDGGGGALRRRYREVHDLFDRIERVEKPVILAAQGPCLGGALELALSCDFRIAADVASFGFPELKLAVLPGSGGVSRTTRLVGPAWARWRVLAGQTVDAATAHRIGLVHAVVPAAELDRTVEALAASLAELPAEAVGLAKLTIDLCDALERGSGRDVERIANSLLMPSQEHKQRVEAFKSRRRGE